MYHYNPIHDSLAEEISILLASKVGQIGLRIRVKDDFEEWAYVLRNAPATTAVSPAFDPDFCDLEDALWLELRDGGEWPVGTITCKLVAGDFLQLVASGELWYGRRTGSEHAMRLLDGPGLPTLRGQIAYFGGLWLHPDYRGHGMATYMPRLIRAMARRRWRADWHCGGVLKQLADRNLPIKNYGYANIVQVTDGQYFPVMAREDSWYVPWESPEEWAETSRRYIADNEHIAATAPLQPLGGAQALQSTKLRAS